MQENPPDKEAAQDALFLLKVLFKFSISPAYFLP